MGKDDIEYIVRYSKNPVEEPEPKTYRLTIHYLYEDNSEAAPDYIENNLETGAEYTVESPVIDGYTPNEATVSGTIDEDDVEIIVRYVKNPVAPPVDPVQPSQPSQPTPPTQPTPEIPVIRNDDSLDSGLMFLSPLGVVAYVPNTGIISEAIVPMFEQYFAEVILSQVFVMAILAIFAISFAVYFSLRKYLDLNKQAVRKRRNRYSVTKAPKKSTTKAKKHVSKTKSTKAPKKTTKMKKSSTDKTSGQTPSTKKK